MDAAGNMSGDIQAISEMLISGSEELYNKVMADLPVDIEAPTFEELKEVVGNAIESITNSVREAAECVKNALLAMNNEVTQAIAQKVAELTALIENIFAQATSADLVIDDDFKYVAIGDGSAESESYVNMLAECLNAEAEENKVGPIDVVNYAKEGNTVAAERADLSDVSDADLITVGFSHVGFLDDAINGDVEMDWASIVGEEKVAYIDQLMAEVEKKIAAAPVPLEMQAMAAEIVEAYAYSAIEYAIQLPELVNEIHAANDEALIVIVGMSNPFKNITLALNENTTLDIGEYVDYLVTGVAVHGTAYAILSGNAIYVDAPAAAPIYAKDAITMADIAMMGLGGLADALYPSEAGHAYTAGKIAEALRLSFEVSSIGILGDADGNGRIQTNDAKLILQYCAEMVEDSDLDLAVCDVDGNGRYQTNDAKLILQYCAEMIEKFPVEE